MTSKLSRPTTSESRCRSATTSTSAPSSMLVPRNSDACGTQSRCIVERPGWDCFVPSSRTRGAGSSRQRALNLASRSELPSAAERGSPSRASRRRSWPTRQAIGPARRGTRIELSVPFTWLMAGHHASRRRSSCAPRRPTSEKPTSAAIASIAASPAGGVEHDAGGVAARGIVAEGGQAQDLGGVGIAGGAWQTRGHVHVVVTTPQTTARTVGEDVPPRAGVPAPPALVARTAPATRPGRVGRGRGPGRAVGLRRARRRVAASHPRLAVALVRRGRHVLALTRVARADAPRAAALGVDAARVLPAGLGLGAAGGRDELGLRSLSAAAGIATVPVAYAAARELAGRRAGLIAALLVAVSPMLVWYSQEARSYALLVLLSTASLWLMARARSWPAAGRLVGWAIVAALALWTHYFALFVVAPEALLLMALRGVPLRRRLAGPVLVALLASPLPALALTQRTRTYWFLGLPLPRRVGDNGHLFLVGFRPPATTAAFATAAAAVAVGLVRSPSAPTRPSGAGRSWPGSSAWARSPCPSGALAGTDYVNGRNLVGALVPLLVVVAAGLGARRAGILGVAATAAIVATSFSVLDAAREDRVAQRPGFRQVATVIGAATAGARSCSTAAGPGRARSASTCRGRGGCRAAAPR